MPVSDQESSELMRAAAVVQPAAELLRSRSHLYFELEVAEHGGVAVCVRHHRPEDAALAEYGEGHFETDPLTLPFRDWLSRSQANLHGPSIVALGEVPGPARTAYEQRFLGRAGISDVIGLGIPVTIGTRQRVVCFGFHRCASDPSFTHSDKRKLSHLAAGLQLQAENVALRRSIALASAVNRSLSENAGCEWALFDRRFRLQEASSDVFASFFPTTDRSQGFGASVRTQLMAIARSGTAGTVTIRSRLGPAHSWLLKANLIASSGSEPLWLIERHPSREKADVGEVLRTSRLSPREQQVARSLVAGNSNPETARLLGITLNTVENHLRSVYAKFGVSTRTQLLGTLLAAT